MRVDFLGLDSRGALPRATPVDEPVETAWVGVTSLYVTERTPDEILLAWRGFETETPVPATVTDPESSRSIELTAASAELRWRNELSEDPTPVVTAVSVEPRLLWLPVASLGLIGLAILAAVASVRRGRPDGALAVARVGLAGACVLAPAVDVSVPLSGGGTPNAGEAKRILARLLPNVYRAFEFPTESVVYDRLALTVTGETLTEIYLEHRRAVHMEERGGARARIEAVEVLDTGDIEPESPAGFVAETAWTVGGTVTHFGHRHFRQNRYDARVSVVPVDGRWKIRSIEILDEQRLR